MTDRFDDHDLPSGARDVFDPDQALAEHLGEELDAGGREILARRRRDDPDLDAEAAGLEETLAWLRRLDAPPVAALGDAFDETDRALAPPVPARSRTGTIIRYAAVAAIAFGAGILAHALATAPPASTEPAPHPVAETPSTDAGGDFDRRFARAWGAAGDTDGLSRALVAMHLATGQKKRAP